MHSPVVRINAFHRGSTASRKTAFDPSCPPRARAFESRCTHSFAFMGREGDVDGGRGAGATDCAVIAVVAHVQLLCLLRLPRWRRSHRPRPPQKPWPSPRTTRLTTRATRRTRTVRRRQSCRLQQCSTLLPSPSRWLAPPGGAAHHMRCPLPSAWAFPPPALRGLMPPPLVSAARAALLSSLCCLPRPSDTPVRCPQASRR